MSLDPRPRRPAREFLATVAALGCALACQRGEPDRGAAASAVRHPETAPATSPQPAAPSAAHPTCLFPLADIPPPQATRATLCPPDPGGPPALPHAWVTFPGAPGEPRVAVEVAETDAARERGLMYRTSMPEDQGMIFSWSEEERRTFWMHDTCIPLDMLYIAGDGTIVGVLEQVPPLNDAPRGIPCPVAHVLELNAGWTRAHGVAPGQRIKLER